MNTNCIPGIQLYSRNTSRIHMNTHNNIRDKKRPLFDKKCLCSRDCAAYDAARLAILELPALVGELVEEQLGWPARRSVVEHARQTAAEVRDRA